MCTVGSSDFAGGGSCGCPPRVAASGSRAVSPQDTSTVSKRRRKTSFRIHLVCIAPRRRWPHESGTIGGMTQELFRQDAYLRESPATLIAIGEQGVVLDRTVFYPLGGGQAGDSGVLVLADGSSLAIVDTRKCKDV